MTQFHKDRAETLHDAIADELDRYLRTGTMEEAFSVLGYWLECLIGNLPTDQDRKLARELVHGQICCARRAEDCQLH
jgi:hypothetical protein